MASFRHIVAALDLSRSSAHVLSEAVAVARSCGARLTVLHVATPPIDGEVRDDLRELLADFISEAPAAGALPIHLDLVAGDPGREILSFAAAHEVDLIVIGRRHHGVVDRLLLESVGEIVTRQARCAVLSVGVEPPARRPAGGVLSDILCAVDLTDTSGETLDLASNLALTASARLTVLHVIDPSRWKPPLPVAPEEVEAMQNTLAAEAYERLAILLSRSLTAEHRADTLVSFGLVPNQIVGAASAAGAQLLVVGAHSRRFLGHTFLGSTAREVVRLALRPVLLARPAPKEAGARTSDRPSEPVAVH